MGSDGPFPYLADVPLYQSLSVRPKPVIITRHDAYASLRPTKKPRKEAFLSKKDLVACRFTPV